MSKIIDNVIAIIVLICGGIAAVFVTFLIGKALLEVAFTALMYCYLIWIALTGLYL